MSFSDVLKSFKKAFNYTLKWRDEKNSNIFLLGRIFDSFREKSQWPRQGGIRHIQIFSFFKSKRCQCKGVEHNKNKIPHAVNEGDEVLRLYLYPNFDALPWEFLKISGHAMQKLIFFIFAWHRRHLEKTCNKKFPGEDI